MDLLQKIYDAGVVGAGGAGFPTHVKLKCKVDYLIINAAECEPLLNTDKYLMLEKGKEIIRAIEEVGKLVDAQQVFIAIKEKNAKEINHLKHVIKELDAKVSIFLLEDYYPAGDEQMMIYEVTGRSIPEAGIPLDVGAVVSNVATMLNIYDAISDIPVTQKYITIVGEVENPTMLKVPIGTTVKECIDAAGGSLLEKYAIIIGGPMMGKIIDDIEADVNYIGKTDGSLILLPKDHYIVERKRKPIEKIINETRSACIQCRFCTELCHRFLLGHKLRPHKIMRNIGMSEHNEEIMKEALLCCECGICELYSCPMGLSPRLVNVYVKGELRKKGIKHEKGKQDIQSSEMIDYRRIPVKRLMSRLDILKYYGQSFGNLQELAPTRVCISLSQHIGRPASSIVSVGDRVKKGQLIGRVGRDDMGANVHASLDGVVMEISDKVMIQKEDKGVSS